jgi:gluconate 2-dehydrogenase gamma chain
MNSNQSARRQFLLQTGGAAAIAWADAQWPAILAAAQHAHDAAKSSARPHFEVLTAEQARNVEAIASQIIPTDDLPGAREAGVVFFIDLALKTFAKDSLPLYEKGLVEVNQLTAEKFPGVKVFADATPEQQEVIMHELDEHSKAANTAGSRRRGQFGSSDFMQTIWQHTVLGFLADPEAGGNRDYAGWKVIDRDPAHTFSPPFGFYDKDYPGWQPSPETEKK